MKIVFRTSSIVSLAAALLLSGPTATSGPTTNISRILFGNDTEHAYAVAVDASGNSYVTGVTYSATSFPAGTGAAVVHGIKTCSLNQVGGPCPNSAYAGDIVAQLLFGGSGSTQPRAIAVDGNYVYVVGSTNSPTVTMANGRRAAVNYSYGTRPSSTNSRSFLAKFSLNFENIASVTSLGADTKFGGPWGRGRQRRIGLRHRPDVRRRKPLYARRLPHTGSN